MHLLARLGSDDVAVAVPESCSTVADLKAAFLNDIGDGLLGSADSFDLRSAAASVDDVSALSDWDVVDVLPSRRALARATLESRGLCPTADGLAAAAAARDAPLCALYAAAGVHPECLGESLMAAARRAHADVVAALLAAGAPVAAQDAHGRTALWHAVEGHGQRGSVATVRLLLDAGVDATVCDRGGWGCSCPLARLLERAAADACHRQQEQTLRQHLPQQRRQPRRRRASERRPAAVVVRMLLDGGAVACDEAVLHAAAAGDVAVLKQLLDAGGSARAVDPQLGSSALVKAAHRGCAEAVRLLAARGADVNAANCVGHTALMKAADRRHDRVVELLLELGASVCVESLDGNTALNIAHAGDQLNIAERLINAGAKV
eukprot:Rhum_TRINITY_DN12383_c1_g2::Rhum_TRINITY_DN12383_c1_g2_i1::g.51499::m.51499